MYLLNIKQSRSFIVHYMVTDVRSVQSTILNDNQLDHYSFGQTDFLNSICQTLCIWNSLDLSIVSEFQFYRTIRAFLLTYWIELISVGSGCGKS